MAFIKVQINVRWMIFEWFGGRIILSILKYLNKLMLIQYT